MQPQFLALRQASAVVAELLYRNAALTRQAMVVAVAMLGLGCTVLFGWQGIEHTVVYGVFASALLCFGLYMAVFGINKAKARENWLFVVVAVTFGVLSKYVMIFTAMYAVTYDWRYAVLAMAVAQIDPLSVAALENDERLSSRTQTILSMWASFDDPATALATPLLLGIAASRAHQDLAQGPRAGRAFC